MIDLDSYDCAPALKTELLQGISKEENFVFNIAVDEAESWLMADRDNFAKVFGLPVEHIPQCVPKRYNGPHIVNELDFPFKPSYYLTHTLAALSSDSIIKAQLLANGDACKGTEYNDAILPFIDNVWNIKEAQRNSNSLQRMVNRLIDINTRITP